MCDFCVLGRIIWVQVGFRVFEATVVVICVSSSITLFVLVFDFGSVFFVLVIGLDLSLPMHAFRLLCDVASASHVATLRILLVSMCCPMRGLVTEDGLKDSK